MSRCLERSCSKVDSLHMILWSQPENEEPLGCSAGRLNHIEYEDHAKHSQIFELWGVTHLLCGSGLVGLCCHGILQEDTTADDWDLGQRYMEAVWNASRVCLHQAQRTFHTVYTSLPTICVMRAGAQLCLFGQQCWPALFRGVGTYCQRKIMFPFMFFPSEVFAVLWFSMLCALSQLNMIILYNWKLWIFQTWPNATRTTTCWQHFKGRFLLKISALGHCSSWPALKHLLGAIIVEQKAGVWRNIDRDRHMPRITPEGSTLMGPEHLSGLLGLPEATCSGWGYISQCCSGPDSIQIPWWPKMVGWTTRSLFSFRLHILKQHIHLHLSC